MTKTRLFPAAAIGASLLGSSSLLAPAARAQSVEFRIVERTGRAIVTGPQDAELNFGVQARVVGASGPNVLGTFSFTVHLVGEPEANGILARGLISNLDGTYVTTVGTSSAVGRGGLASTYSYLAGANPGLNGLLNASAGGFTNGPDQEIGIVSGAAIGTSLLNTPGLDADADGNPDSWSGNGLGAAPANNATAPIDLGIAAEYLAADNHWIDVYRFRYTITNFPTRTFAIRLDSLSAEVASQLMYQSGIWGTHPLVGVPSSANQILIAVATTGAGSCCDFASGACTLVSAAECAGAFTDASACDPHPCAASGRCCDTTGACFLTFQAFCDSTWSATETCTPAACPQPGPCCDAGGGCTMRLVSLCNGTWTQTGSCSPNVCPAPGRCCNWTGRCTVVAPHWCSGGWSAGTSCSPNPCASGACCNNITGVCTVATQFACAANSTFLGAGATCGTTTCPRVACCVPSTGVCSTIGPAGTCPVGSTALGSGTCSPNPCPRLGRCCMASGSCAITFATACDGFWGVGDTCAPTACPSVGSCCFDGHICYVRPLSLCVAATFRPGTACGTPLNPIGCCPANFNQVNGVEVQDLYDFLAAWFSHDDHADFDASGSLTLSDVLQFMNAWTAGCH